MQNKQYNIDDLYKKTSQPEEEVQVCDNSYLAEVVRNYLHSTLPEFNRKQNNKLEDNVISLEEFNRLFYVIQERYNTDLDCLVENNAYTLSYQNDMMMLRRLAKMVVLNENETNTLIDLCGRAIEERGLNKLYKGEVNLSQFMRYQLKSLDLDNLSDEELDVYYSVSNLFGIEAGAYDNHDLITSNLKTLYFDSFFEIQRTEKSALGKVKTVCLYKMDHNGDIKVDLISPKEEEPIG